MQYCLVHHFGAPDKRCAMLEGHQSRWYCDAWCPGLGVIEKANIDARAPDRTIGARNTPFLKDSDVRCSTFGRLAARPLSGVGEVDISRRDMALEDRQGKGMYNDGGLLDKWDRWPSIKTWTTCTPSSAYSEAANVTRCQETSYSGDCRRQACEQFYSLLVTYVSTLAGQACRTYVQAPLRPSTIRHHNIRSRVFLQVGVAVTGFYVSFQRGDGTRPSAWTPSCSTTMIICRSMFQRLSRQSPAHLGLRTRAINSHRFRNFQLKLLSAQLETNDINHRFFGKAMSTVTTHPSLLAVSTQGMFHRL
jgi:hypothetical protein